MMTTSPVNVLRSHGIQATAQRLGVMKAVSQRPHVSADVVLDMVQLDIGAVSRQAVYDALNLLVANGLVRRIQPVGSPARFEDRVNDNHHHLICRLCGDVVDVDCVVGAAPCLEASDTVGFEVDEAEIAFWGRCAKCQKVNRTSTRLDPRTNRREQKHKNAAQSS